jgi:hypothetical protein
MIPSKMHAKRQTNRHKAEESPAVSITVGNGGADETQPCRNVGESFEKTDRKTMYQSLSY